MHINLKSNLKHKLFLPRHIFIYQNNIFGYFFFIYKHILMPYTYRKFSTSRGIDEAFNTQEHTIDYTYTFRHRLFYVIKLFRQRASAFLPAW